jgi:hypothetical protein
MQTTRRLATLAGALVLAFGAIALPATAASAAERAPERAASTAAGGEVMSPCGFYTWDGTAYYHHCAGNHIMIEVDDWGANSYLCINPWDDRVLGSTWDISGAWYVWNVDHC